MERNEYAIGIDWSTVLKDNLNALHAKYRYTKQNANANGEKKIKQ